MANFCRNCGGRYEATPGPSPAPGRGRPSLAVIFMGAAIVVAGAGVALAILLGNGGDSAESNGPSQGRAASGSGRTVAATATRPDGTRSALEAGRYVQAGSFKSVAGAETEQQRLAALGTETGLISSGLAQELYPGFQVLVVGPLTSPQDEAAIVRRLRRQGVPSAFARDLEPATGIGSFSDVSGRWTGSLEEMSSAHPNLNRTLPVTVTFGPSGREGQLRLPSLGCRQTLTATGSATGPSLNFDQDSPCLGSGTWQLRPSEGTLMLTLLPPGDDLIFLGTLGAG
jgi:hypothetical protein